jgi:hypothetical protein
MNWIKRNWYKILIVIVACFVVVDKLGNYSFADLTGWVKTNWDKLFDVVPSLISAIAVSVALYFNAETQRQNKKASEPQLSMRLDILQGFVCVVVQNNGKTAAQKISVTVKSITNNGENILFDGASFIVKDLYPTETYLHQIAIYGANLGTGELFPEIDIGVEYSIYGTKNKRKYSRTIVYSKAFGQKILADVNFNAAKIENSLGSLSRDVNRATNYVTGSNLFTIDEVNILFKHFLRDDMRAAITGENIREKKDAEVEPSSDDKETGQAE